MGQTLFITGTSSGIGKAAALYFAAQGWNVAATMRSPEKHSAFAQYPHVKTYSLDVTDSASITTAVSQTIQDFGAIDVLVNNAGFSVFGAFECAAENEIHQQLDTNLLGVMNVTRAVLPHFRQRKSGRIITVVSKSNTIKDYDPYVERVKQSLLNANPNSFDPPIAVAKTILRAATDRGSRMRYPVGNANVILALRRLLPLAWFHRFVSRSNGI